MPNDAHCHFFSSGFFRQLAEQRGRSESAEDICRALGWDAPGEPEDLAERWCRELDARGVGRAALISSLPGDEPSVARAVAHRPERFVGFYMLNAAAADAVERARTFLDAARPAALCLFPAMHHVPLDDPRTAALVEVAADRGAAVFVHCGALSVGVRKRLGLPNPFDPRLGDPLAVARLAARYPSTPFVIPHFGAGMFREALMAVDTCANVHLDTSSSNGWVRYHPGLTLTEVFRAALTVAGPTRLLFGTDSSFFPRGWQQGILDQQTAALDELGVATDARQLIFGGNFDRLFGGTR